jgi:hypothetical protein
VAAIVPLALIASACRSEPGAPSAPSTPTTPTPSPNSGSYVVSGTISDRTNPIAGANVSAWIGQGNGGYSYTWAYGALLTDSAGHYQLKALAAGVRVWLQVSKADYFQQCAAPQITLQNDTTVDAQLVSTANLNASLDQPTRAGSRSVSGVVVEETPSGKRAVSGAFVDFEPLEDFPAATTLADGAGRFMLCGLPSDAANLLLSAALAQRVAYVKVPLGQNDIEIVLP